MNKIVCFFVECYYRYFIYLFEIKYFCKGMKIIRKIQIILL